MNNNLLRIRNQILIVTHEQINNLKEALQSDQKILTNIYRVITTSYSRPNDRVVVNYVAISFSGQGNVKNLGTLKINKKIVTY